MRTTPVNQSVGQLAGFVAAAREGAAHVGREVGEEGVDLAEIKPAGDVLRDVFEHRGQISRQRVEHLV
jgi:hypothetical protein